MSEISLYIAQSLDGFIAAEDGGVEWLETFNDSYENGVAGSSYPEFLQGLDCLIVGATTYLQVLTFGEWPYGELPTVVVTRRRLTPANEHVMMYSGDLKELVEEVLPPEFEKIWLVGGAELAREFLRLDLVDEIRLSVIPMLLGSGIPLFDDSGVARALHLTNSIAYSNGIVELCYDIIKPEGNGE